MGRRDLVLLALAGLALLMSLGFFLGAPRLEAVAPAEGEEVAVGWVEVRLTFSRPVRLKDVAARVAFDPAVPGAWRLEGEGRVAVFTPEAPWPPGSQVAVQVDAGLRAAGWLPIPSLRTRRWRFRVAPVRLAYLWPADGPADLYAFDLETGEARRLTELGGVVDYAIGPQGRWVYLSVENAQQGADLYFWDRLGEAAPQRRIVCGAARCVAPAPSPDGEWLAYEREGRIWVWRLPAGPAQPLSPPGARAAAPRWRPQRQGEQSLLYFVPDRGVCVVRQVIDGKEVARLPADDTCVWSADGRAVFTVRFHPLPEVTDAQGAPLTAAHVWRYDLAADTALDLSPSPEVEDAAPTPDGQGRWVALGRRWLSPLRWTLGRQLWLMRPDGSEAHPVTHSPAFQHLAFAWGPTGRYLAFVRSDQAALAAPLEVWLLDVEQGGMSRVVSNGYAPGWLP